MKLQNKPEAKSAVDTAQYAALAGAIVLGMPDGWVEALPLTSEQAVVYITAAIGFIVNYIGRKTGVKITVRRNGAHPSAPEANDFQTPTNEGA